MVYSQNRIFSGATDRIYLKIDRMPGFSKSKIFGILIGRKEIECKSHSLVCASCTDTRTFIHRDVRRKLRKIKRVYFWPLITFYYWRVGNVYTFASGYHLSVCLISHFMMSDVDDTNDHFSWASR